jgi:hemerythrin-like domain-containing protein
MNPIQLLKQDHRTVKRLFRQFEKATRTADKQKLGQEIIEELSIHAAIEEQLIYPLIRGQGERSEEALLNALEEHHAVKVILAELDGMTADHERYAAKVHVVRESVEMHIKEEEARVLPRLDAMLGDEDRKLLAESMLELKPVVPNHPHPSAPDEPPASVMTGMLSLVTDAGKDVVRRLTSAEKTAAHRRVVRRADAAIEQARGRGRRSKSAAARSSRKRTRKASGTRRGARKSRARRTNKSRTSRRSSKARR